MPNTFISWSVILLVTFLIAVTNACGSNFREKKHSLVSSIKWTTVFWKVGCTYSMVVGTYDWDSSLFLGQERGEACVELETGCNSVPTHCDPLSQTLCHLIKMSQPPKQVHQLSAKIQTQEYVCNISDSNHNSLSLVPTASWPSHDEKCFYSKLTNS